MKRVEWLGSSRKEVSSWPEPARQRLGYQLYRLQVGERPTDSRTLRGVGQGIFEIRVHEKVQYRVACVEDPERIVVLHAWIKKSRKTEKPTLDLIRRRFRLLQGD